MGAGCVVWNSWLELWKGIRNLCYGCRDLLEDWIIKELGDVVSVEFRGFDLVLCHNQ